MNCSILWILLLVYMCVMSDVTRTRVQAKNLRGLEESDYFPLRRCSLHGIRIAFESVNSEYKQDV
jgi:hypothetical protein